MGRFTPQELGIIVSMFLRNNSSVIKTQREFRRRFPARSPDLTSPLSLGFFEISGVCEQATDSRSSKRKHSSRNKDHIAGSITASYAKCHK
ncbi:unnamed protein product [Pieris macdunnoughi]|uniref:DUF4817 domain-containing protein n=1 Tax=Pieris macdunnoughi TaxID=345717 RepID=A0A821X657_9NEOP|nr:unnamed protein product [Pieris macdunnoughi]